MRELLAFIGMHLCEETRKILSLYFGTVSHRSRLRHGSAYVAAWVARAFAFGKPKPKDFATVITDAVCHFDGAAVLDFSKRGKKGGWFDCTDVNVTKIGEDVFFKTCPHNARIALRPDKFPGLQPGVCD